MMPVVFNLKGIRANCMFEQLLVTAVLLAALALFLWEHWRYDLVAVMALLTLCITGIVPADEAFSGFGHPAVITVAAVLILSQGLMNAGVIDVLSRHFGLLPDNTLLQVGSLTVLVAFLSAFINNVGAVALLMPVTIQVARKFNKSPSMLLMPLAFGSLLGGMVTLIGTPSNLIIASYRGKISGDPFTMFDFAPVGLLVVLAGVIFISLIGWRLIPCRESQRSRQELFQIEEYTSELHVPEDSKAIGQSLREIEDIAEGEVVIVSLLRGEQKIIAPPEYERLRADDILIVEAGAEDLKTVLDNTGLELTGKNDEDEAEKEKNDPLQSEETGLLEVIVLPDSRFVGKTAKQMNIRWHHGINLLAVARHGARLKQRLMDIRFRAGDILLLQGPRQGLAEALQSFGCLPLAERGLTIGQPRRLLLGIGLFGTAIAINVAGLLPIHIALVAAATLMLLTRLLSLREAYDAIDWPIIVLLAAMLPVGRSLETTGAAESLVLALQPYTVDLSPAAIVALLLVVAMLLSNLVNNTAAAILMAPIAYAMAETFSLASDPLLMAVAVGSAAAFMTPIGHQSNTLVMGPGGYRFGDYWRLGLPISIIVTLVAVPLILWIWPF